MNKINFVNEQAPALNANNLNLLQTNTENAITECLSNARSYTSTTATSLRGEITNAINTSSNNTQTQINEKLQYGTSLPSSANNGTIFFLYN